MEHEVVTKELQHDRVWRLQHLREVIENAAEQSFDLMHWGTRGFAQSACGSVACAGGWAATDPTFRKLGLEPYSEHVCVPTMRVTPGAYSTGYGALGQFFGLPRVTAAYLFGPGPKGQRGKAEFFRRLDRVESAIDRKLI